jgi:hypothetical protein
MQQLSVASHFSRSFSACQAFPYRHQGSCKFLSKSVESIGFAGKPSAAEVQQIEAAYARNLAVNRSRQAAIPEVGIFG